jgi:hypothetical protein
METPPNSQVPSKPSKPPWAAHIWQGLDFFAWLRILARSRFKVHWSLWYLVVIITVVSFGNTLLRWLQQAIWGRRIRQTEITQPPIFILGHWRTGTTFLHELLIQDQRHGYPTTYECMGPNHFLLTERFARFLKFLMPAHRPMDNMKVGFDRPQEDEFALCMLGQRSPYLTIAFPNNPPQDGAYLDLEGISTGALHGWQRTLVQFLKLVTYKTGKRLVLKSPPHTARIKVLKEMFPGALFIHIMRDPYVVYASTVNLWKILYQTQGLQKPTYAGLEEYVLSTYTRIYQRLEEGKKLLGPNQFYELRYEDLVKNPAGELRKVYDHLHMGGWDEFAPRLEEFLATLKGYETNKFQLTAEQRAVIKERWGEVIDRYGY